MQSKFTQGLNPEQQKAVLTTEGPLLILAGAGSGKTKTITHRIAYILENNLAGPAEILAVSFTNKAAGEMRERVAGLDRSGASHKSTGVGQQPCRIAWQPVWLAGGGRCGCGRLASTGDGGFGLVHTGGWGCAGSLAQGQR